MLTCCPDKGSFPDGPVLEMVSTSQEYSHEEDVDRLVDDIVHYLKEKEALSSSTSGKESVEANVNGPSGDTLHSNKLELAA